ncbi:hypothetical protein ABDK00_014185 [Niabella insulamsoli]|uniref:hypothetical protein n=1 Tax=Niabella insulamsoli TaxID=3144874 RepID=UPI0031FD9E2C
MTVSTPSKTGELLPVLKEQRICSIPDPEEPLSAVLRYCMLLVGVRANNLPGKIEKGVLLQFIKDNYGGHTVSEIRLAFDKAIAGKLDIDDTNCYENFSPAYFAKIMNSYRRWAADQYRQEVKEEFKQRDYTEEELRIQQRVRAAEFYYRIKNGNVESVPDDVKDILVHDGKIENVHQASSFFVDLLNRGVTGLYYERID